MYMIVNKDNIPMIETALCVGCFCDSVKRGFYEGIASRAQDAAAVQVWTTTGDCLCGGCACICCDARGILADRAVS